MTSSAQPRRSASSTIRPRRGSTGSWASRRPSGVRRLPGGRRRVERAELVQQRDAVADLAAVGRVEEREVLDLAEPERLHLQDHRREARAQDLGVGVGGPRREVLLGVQADADAVGLAAAAALALVGRGARDGLDRQPLDLQPRAVAADPRRAGIDDRADAGHGQRRLGDVRREHDAARVVRLEDALLLLRGEARVQRQHLDLRRRARPVSASAVSRISRSPRQEHEHVAGAVAQQLLDGVADRVDGVAVDEASASSSSSASGRRRRAAGGPTAAGSAPRRDTCGPTPRRPARRRSASLKRPGSIVALVMTSLRSGRCGQQAVQVAEQEVDVQAALVRLVDDDRVVAAQQPVVLDLGEQQAVGDEAHERVASARRSRSAPRSRRPRRAGRRAPRRSARRPCARRAGAAGCGRSRRARRGRARGRSSAAGSSCPTRSRRRR